MSLPSGDQRDDGDQRDQDARVLGELVRETSEAAEAARRASMPARRKDMAARKALAAAIERGPGHAILSRALDLVRGPWLASPRGRAWAFVALAASLACAALFVFGGGKLGYRVDGGDEAGGYVRAQDHAVALRFDDGSSFSFPRGSSGRVSAVSAHGASVALEDGVVEAYVVRRSGARWSTLAGPWEVAVTGTRFDVAWDPRERSLRVDLLEGKVTVRGPGAEDGIALHAGQSLRARDGDGIHVSSLDRTAASSVAPLSSPSTAGSALPLVSASSVSVPSSAPAAPSASVQAPASSSSAAPSPADRTATSWTELVAKGRHEQVLAEARERGIPLVLSSATAADLLALADASRYGGDSALSPRALQALRDRFAGTKASTDAAFLLGRMADDSGSSASAIRWYDTHMAEGGSFSAEALGRKMIAVRKSGGDAKALARDYLERYPRGPHATVARGLASGDVGFDKGASPR